MKVTVVEVRMNQIDPGSDGVVGGCLPWAVRIAVTLFVVPFFVVGFGLLFGGGMFGGVGSFGSLFGLPFIAIPALMLFVVWTAKPAAGPLGRKGPFFAPEVGRRWCAYCGREREVSTQSCPSCGAHETTDNS